MAQNVASPDVKEIPLSTFCGLVTNQNPVALPMGASPDCSDCTFLPGGASSRPALDKVFATPMGTATVTYGKSYVDNKGTIRNLYLDSAGNLWVENLTASPGVYSLLAATTPGSYAKSITAFGREYIAISDGLHGQDIPLQYDGTNLDRVTQDGPGAPPSVTSFSLPSVIMLASAVPGALTVLEIDPAGISGPGGYYTSVNISVVAGADSLDPGSIIVVTGTSATFNLTYTVTATYADTVIACAAYFPAGTASYIGAGSVATTSGITMSRAGNIVTVNTAAVHQLQPGYQAQITGVTAAVIGTSITTVVINNENLPGLATVTTTDAHGLIPGLFVSLVGIVGASVGGGIASISRNGQVVTVRTASANGLNPGGVVTIAGVTTTSFNTTAIVQNIVSTTTFTFIQVDSDASDSTGTVTLNWPVTDTPTPTYFQVQSAPTTKTFQVQVNYSDGAWTGGTVAYAWDGTFFVQSTPSTTSFTYQQYGPDATSVSVGTVTPYGQASPGIKQMRVSFLTRQGYLTRPSPPVLFVSNGGQYLSVTNLPIGPSNIVARVLQFTGAQGAYFFYIPAPPQVNGQLVGTATQINDNTTQSAVLDFSDNTLFAALGVSIQGNNLANQIILDGALGFGSYASRLIAYGQRSTVQNLLNMSFDGGYLPSSLASGVYAPSGWTAGTGGALSTAGHYGDAWEIAVPAGTGSQGVISQSFYEDYSGAPIATAGTQYKVRLWIKANVAAADLTFTVKMSSASTAFTATATIAGNLMSATGSWLEATFSAKTPDPIPADFLLSVYASSSATNVSLWIDEISVIYADAPYRTGLYGSYVNNPEAFDGLSGAFGPQDDTRQVMDLGIIRSNLYLLTQDPTGMLHQTSQGNTEPAGWVVDQIGSNCGAVSAFCLTRSQAASDSASGGEEWFAWYSSSGVRIFGGDNPHKISQEIQRPTGQTFPGAPADLSALNAAAQLTVWGLNDPAQKLLWFGIPASAATAPSIVYAMSYLGLDSAGEIAANSPVHQSITGKLSARDLSRKWSPWKITMNGAALMYRESGELTPVFFGGNGLIAGGAAGFGNVYTLNPALYTDDDYGLIRPYYVTYAFPDRDQEQGLQLGAHMKMVAYTGSFISGVGILTLSILYDSLANTWPLTGVYTLQTSPLFDLEWPGGNCQAQRFFFRFATSPDAGGGTASPATDNAFSLTTFIPAIKPAKHIPVRGAYV